MKNKLNISLLIVFSLLIPSLSFSASQISTDQIKDSAITTAKINNGAVTSAKIDSTVTPSSRTVNGHALTSNVTVTPTDLSLGNVENTALSTWAGTTNLTTLGTIGTGLWHGTAIDDSYISSASTWNAKQNALGYTPLNVASNLSDLTSVSTARTNLGLAIGSDVQSYNANTAFRTDKLSVFAATSSSELAGIISDESGTGSLVFGTSPTFTTPNLGTPSTLVGTNITGTASGLTAGNVTTNANLSGDITSVGNTSTYAGTVPLNKGGTGQTTKAPAFDALQPMTTLGDIIYGGTSGTGTRLAGNTTTTKKSLVQTGNGTVSAAPQWGQLALTDLNTNTDLTLGSGTGLSNASKNLYIGNLLKMNTTVSADPVNGAGLIIYGYGSGSYGANISLAKPSVATSASAAQFPSNNDILGDINSLGYDSNGGGYTTGTILRTQATQNWTASNQGARFLVKQIFNNSITPTNVLWLEDGDLALGSTATSKTGNLYANVINGNSLLTALSTKTTTYAITANDYTLVGDSTSAGFTMTLPTAVGKTGQIYTLKKKSSDANTITIATTSSQTIDGSTTYSLLIQYSMIAVQSDGSNWQIISKI